MPDRAALGVVDTSVIIDLPRLDRTVLPDRITIAAVTLAELAVGPAATDDPDERARRQDRLQRVEAVFDPIPFDVEAARAFGRVAAAVLATGRKPRSRFADLQIAATALANNLPLVTRNPGDFAGIEHLLHVISV